MAILYVTGLGRDPASLQILRRKYSRYAPVFSILPRRLLKITCSKDLMWLSNLKKPLKRAGGSIKRFKRKNRGAYPGYFGKRKRSLSIFARQAMERRSIVKETSPAY